ncbi:MAG: hypothetical protein ACJ8NR_14695 [Sulfurifustis sp.]
MQSIVIAHRFNGPPNSGNGGYASGLVANAIGQTVRVRLRKALALDTPLSVIQNSADEWQLRDANDVLAAAVPASVEVTVPAPPSYESACTAARGYPSVEDHDLPHCFVCGPGRAPGDGLRIFAAPLPGTSLVAAPWQPDRSLADAGGVKSEFVWAALDCPGAFASGSDKPMLLGELAARIERRPNAEERCVVLGWPIATEGRKHKVGTAVFGADGAVCAVGLATWIELKE